MQTDGRFATAADRDRRWADMFRGLYLTFLLAAACSSAPAERDLLAVLDSVPQVRFDAHARAEFDLAVYLARTVHATAAGVRPGAGIRWPFRCGSVAMSRGTRVAIRLHPECCDLVVPRIVELHPDSGVPYDPGEFFPAAMGTSDSPPELLLTRVLDGYAIGVLLDEARGSTPQLCDEAWCTW
jgi:hypothetical protein